MLLTCRECGHRVSTMASICPGCGAPAPKDAPSSALRAERTSQEPERHPSRQASIEAGSVAPISAGETAPPTTMWRTVGPAPWSRYVARMLDTSLLSLLFFAALGTIIMSGLFGRSAARILESPLLNNPFISSALAFAVTIPMNAAILAWTGGSVGKWLFGIRVLDPRGENLTFAVALRRELSVFAVGLGLGLPIVSLFTTISSFNQLRRDGVAQWDSPSTSIVRYRNHTLLTRLAAALGVFTLLVLLIAIQVLGRVGQV